MHVLFVPPFMLTSNVRSLYVPSQIFFPLLFLGIPSIPFPLGFFRAALALPPPRSVTYCQLLAPQPPFSPLQGCAVQCRHLSGSYAPSGQFFCLHSGPPSHLRFMPPAEQAFCLFPFPTLLSLILPVNFKPHEVSARAECCNTISVCFPLPRLLQVGDVVCYFREFPLRNHLQFKFSSAVLVHLAGCTPLKPLCQRNTKPLPPQLHSGRPFLI